jgi:hypothetical protein
MFRPVSSEMFTVVEGVGRVLQVHSRGDKRFSPFCCSVLAYGRVDSIEQHYQTAKIFEGDRRPRDWREAKNLAKLPPRGLGLRQTSWMIGPRRFDCRRNSAGNSFALDDPGVMFYLRMWHRYLAERPDLIEEARLYDAFEDPFEGSFPFGQAKVFELVSRDGVEALAPMFAPLVTLLGESRTHARTQS